MMDSGTSLRNVWLFWFCFCFCFSLFPTVLSFKFFLTFEYRYGRRSESQNFLPCKWICCKVQTSWSRKKFSTELESPISKSQGTIKARFPSFSWRNQIVHHGNTSLWKRPPFISTLYLYIIRGLSYTYKYKYIHLSISPSLHLSISPSLHPSIHPFHPFIHASISFIYPASIHSFIHLPIPSIHSSFR